MRASAPIFAQIGKFYYKYKKSGKGYRTSLILKLYKENLSLTMQHCINNLCLTTTCKIKTKCIFISFFVKYIFQRKDVINVCLCLMLHVVFVHNLLIECCIVIDRLSLYSFSIREVLYP